MTAAGNHCIAAGLDYPGIGPEHSYLKDLGRVEYAAVDDREVMLAFENLCRLEGIIPALESAHAFVQAFKDAPNMAPDDVIVINQSGRGDNSVVGGTRPSAIWRAMSSSVVTSPSKAA